MVCRHDSTINGYNIMWLSFFQWLAAGLWFSLSTPVYSTNKTDRHSLSQIALKVTLNTIIQTQYDEQKHIL